MTVPARGVWLTTEPHHSVFCLSPHSLHVYATRICLTRFGAPHFPHMPSIRVLPCFTATVFRSIGLSQDARSPRASIVLTFHAFFLCCQLGHTGTSTISARNELKSEGASIRLQHRRRAACDLRLPPIFWAAFFVPRRSILKPRPQVTRLPILRLRL